MPINKVVFGATTLIDITDTTATAADVVHGEHFYDASGSKVEGTLEVHNYYTGTSEPATSTGSNGDLYLKVSN